MLGSAPRACPSRLGLSRQAAQGQLPFPPSAVLSPPRLLHLLPTGTVFNTSWRLRCFHIQDKEPDSGFSGAPSQLCENQETWSLGEASSWSHQLTWAS